MPLGVNQLLSRAVGPTGVHQLQLEKQEELTMGLVCLCLDLDSMLYTNRHSGMLKSDWVKVPSYVN